MIAEYFEENTVRQHYLPDSCPQGLTLTTEIAIARIAISRAEGHGAPINNSLREGAYQIRTRSFAGSQSLSPSFTPNAS